MAQIGFALLYAGAGTLATLLLYYLFPSLGAFPSTLFGILLALALGGGHVLFILRARMRQQEVKILRLRQELGDAVARTDFLQNSIHDLDEGGGGRFEALQGEVRILQSVIDRMMQSKGMNASGEAFAPAQPVKLNDNQVINLVQEAVKADRIEVFLQPIVSLPQRKLRYYEMFTRIRMPDGNFLTADRYLRLAQQDGIITGIDNLQLLRCIQLIRDTERRNSTLRFFCNISSNTLRDTGFMTELVQFLGQNSLLAPKLVFELAQEDLATMSADLVPVLDGLGRLGCRFSMDRVYSLDFPMSALTARKIRTVKIDSDVLLKEYQKVGGDMQLRDLKAQMDRTNVDLVVSKIETEDQLRELLDLNIDYGQGYLFGEPRANWPLT
ncbi:MAG TPA: EAL domain-containing protein [Alphaproteobacteria bacterium]|nr:EAL domain-containing protein [Alphaproteobacteria bacterium]